MPDTQTDSRAWLVDRPIAHRGLHSHDAPENSLAAYQAAIDLGVAIELDVRLTADRQLFIMHDRNTKRMTGTSGVISRQPAAALTKLKLAGTTQSPPLLRDVLNLVKGQVPLLIELKYPGVPKEICSLVIKELSGYKGAFALESFDPRIVWWLRRHAPEVPRGQLAGSLPDDPIPTLAKRVLRAMPLNFLTAPHFIVFDHRDYPTLALSFWRTVLRIPVVQYTIRDDQQLKENHSAGMGSVFEGFKPTA